MGKANVITKPTISFVNYSEIVNWSVRYILKNSFGYNKKYNLFRIIDFLKKNTNVITVKDNVIYSRVTIKLYNKGVQKRDNIKGQYIGTKKQYLVKPEQFIISKIDARNGAFGIIPGCLDGAIITSDFLSYDIDTAKINPGFLNLLTSTKQFLAYCQGASSGTTGRQRINEQSFLNVKIPLPPLEKQYRIVEAYNKRIELSEQQEQRAKQLEQDIESHLFDVLGIEKMEEKKSKKGLQFVRSKDLDRWDVFISQKFSISFKYENTKLQTVINGKPAYGANVKGVKKKSNTRYIRITDINEDGSLNNEFVSPETVEDKYLLKENDFLIARSGNTVGKTFLFKKSIGRAIYAGYLVKYNLNLEKIVPGFLLAFTKSLTFKKWIESNQRVAGQPNINGQEFLQAPIILPPLKIQIEIANTINKMKAKIKTLQLQSEENRKKAAEEFEKEIFQ